jgi:hypothetical protein
MTVLDRDLLGAKSSSCSFHPKPVVGAAKQDEMSASLVQCGSAVLSAQDHNVMVLSKPGRLRGAPEQRWSLTGRL